MLETYTGTQASRILGDTRLTDLGLDSLAAIELAGELQPLQGPRISGQDLLSMTVSQVEQFEYKVRKGSPPTLGSDAPKALASFAQGAEIYPEPAEQDVAKLSVKLTELLVETTGLPSSSIKASMTLEELGVDSLALIEIVSVVSDICRPSQNLNGVTLQTTVKSILLIIEADELDASSDEEESPVNNTADKPQRTFQQRDIQSYSSAFVPLSQHNKNGFGLTISAAPPQFETMTAVYKEADGVKIEADIFMPLSPPTTQPMPIAFMLHGGAHMALSRKTARSPQISHLLQNNILPASLDYRLCPEINIIDGAMTDVRDAFVWAKSTLPSIVATKGFVLDIERIVVIGWSTGGHLAMSTAWTVDEIKQTPPVAILSFYSPVDFLAGDSSPGGKVPIRAVRHMSRDQLMQLELADTPLSKYTVQGGEDSQLGPIRPGDPRSELVLSLFEETPEFALSLLLNGVPGRQSKVGELVSKPPSAERRAAICPTARVRSGEYRVPTFIVHGDTDEVAPLESALSLYEEMQRQGVESEFLAAKRGYHGYDLRLKPGMAGWDEQVAPGYQFLFDQLRNRANRIC